jgi:hypothetical protein
MLSDLSVEVQQEWERVKAVELMRRPWEWRVLFSEADTSFCIGREVRGWETFAEGMTLGDAVAVRMVAENTRPVVCEWVRAGGSKCRNVATRLERGEYLCGECAVGGG